MKRVGRLELRSDRLLLVEGQDEVRFLSALLARELDEVQVIEAGGRDRFPERLVAIRNAARSGVGLRRIGVIRDADLDAAAAFAELLAFARELVAKV